MLGFEIGPREGGEKNGQTNGQTNTLTYADFNIDKFDLKSFENSHVRKYMAIVFC